MRGKRDVGKRKKSTMKNEKWLVLSSVTVSIVVAFCLGRLLHQRRSRKKLKPKEKGQLVVNTDDDNNRHSLGVALNGIEDLIGNTPLLRINSLSTLTGCEIYGKAEFTNVGGSSKDRLALAVINDAERTGKIKPGRGDTIFEGTVGSTGISLAVIAKAKGYKCHIIMPDDQSHEKYAILERLGAHIEKVRPVSITDPNHFVRVAKRRAMEMNARAEKSGNAQEAPRGYFCDQFDTEVNYRTHMMMTGPEVLKQTNGELDAFVMGAGTGGTLTGVSLCLKKELPKVKIVLADPQGSGLYNKALHNVMYASTEAEGSRRRHQVDTVVEGIGLNRMTKNLEVLFNSKVIDDAIRVSDAEAVEMSRFLMDNDGLFLGSSSAVHCVAAYKLAKSLGKGKKIVTLLCDHGTRHLAKFWDDEYIKRAGIDTSPSLFTVNK